MFLMKHHSKKSNGTIQLFSWSRTTFYNDDFETQQFYFSVQLNVLLQFSLDFSANASMEMTEFMYPLSPNISVNKVKKIAHSAHTQKASDFRNVLKILNLKKSKLINFGKCFLIIVKKEEKILPFIKPLNTFNKCSLRKLCSKWRWYHLLSPTLQGKSYGGGGGGSTNALWTLIIKIPLLSKETKNEIQNYCIVHYGINCNLTLNFSSAVTAMSL